MYSLILSLNKTLFFIKSNKVFLVSGFSLTLLMKVLILFLLFILLFLNSVSIIICIYL